MKECGRDNDRNKRNVLERGTGVTTIARWSRGIGSSLQLTLLVLLLWGGAAACHSGSPQTELRSQPTLPGCWSLNLQEDDIERDSVRDWLPRGTLPGVLELDTVVADSTTDEDSYAAYSWFDSRRETDPFSVWTRIPGDSIRVQRSGALSGLMLRMTLASDSLVGAAISFTDVRQLGESSRREAPIVARSVQCPSR